MYFLVIHIILHDQFLNTLLCRLEFTQEYVLKMHRPSKFSFQTQSFSLCPEDKYNFSPCIFYPYMVPGFSLPVQTTRTSLWYSDGSRASSHSKADGQGQGKRKWSVPEEFPPNSWYQKHSKMSTLYVLHQRSALSLFLNLAHFRSAFEGETRRKPSEDMDPGSPSTYPNIPHLWQSKPKPSCFRHKSIQ